jgi:hypothetical protein
MRIIPLSRAKCRLLFALAMAVVVSACQFATNADGQPPDDTVNVPTTQPEVWLCAGERIEELLSPDAEWPFVQQHLKAAVKGRPTNGSHPSKRSA